MRLTADDLAAFHRLAAELFPRGRCVSCGHAESWHHPEQIETPAVGWEVVYRCSGCLAQRHNGQRCPGVMLPARPGAEGEMGVRHVPGVPFYLPPPGGPVGSLQGPERPLALPMRH